MTRSEELRKMVAEATPGPWGVSLPPTVPGHIYSERQGQRGAIVAHLALDNRRKANARLIAQAPTLATDLAAALKREAALREALVDHNDLLRSALQIAKREGVNGEVGTTNWDAYYNRVAVALKRHHQTTNDARAALGAKP